MWWTGPLGAFLLCGYGKVLRWIDEGFYAALMRGLSVWTLILLLGLGNIVTWGAMLGFPAAQFWVAMAFQAGGAPQRAIYWYKDAHANGSWQAGSLLAWFSMSGHYGLPQDDDLANKYYLLGIADDPRRKMAEISVLGYHGAALFDDDSVGFAAKLPDAAISNTLTFFRRQHARGYLPFKFDEEGYLGALKNLKQKQTN